MIKKVCIDVHLCVFLCVSMCFYVAVSVFSCILFSFGIGHMMEWFCVLKVRSTLF